MRRAVFIAFICLCGTAVAGDKLGMHKIDSIFIYGTGTASDYLTFYNSEEQELSRQKALCYYFIASATYETNIDSLVEECKGHQTFLNSSYYMTAMGYLEYSRMKYEESLNYLNYAVELDIREENFLNQVYIGFNFQMLDDMVAAEESFSVAYAKFPGNPYVTYCYADQLLGNGKLDIASAVLNQIDPLYKPSDISRLRGDILYRQKDRKGAMAQYIRATEIDSNNIDGYIGQAICLIDAGQYDSALILLRSKLDRYPAHIWLRYYYGIALVKEGNLDLARSVLESLVIEQPLKIFCEELTFSVYSNSRFRSGGIDFYKHQMEGNGFEACVFYVHYLFLKYNSSQDSAVEALLSEDKKFPSCLDSLDYLEQLYLVN